MNPSVEHPDTVRFGEFEIDPHSGELRKRGRKVKLQEKPYQIIEILLEEPGRMVSREELTKRLWPDDTFVDFERGLNTAIGKLRTALGDSAEKPRYIETVARRGYRFIGTIEPPGAPTTSFSSRKTAVLAIVVAAVALVATFLLLSRTPTPTPSKERPKIAVLPFENLGPPEDEYFTDGVTEEIMSRLAGVSGLGVISSNSSSQYKDTAKATHQIGEELDVRYLLEGTVRWQKGSPDGDPGRVKVTPKLIRVSDDTQLWSDVYDRVTEDLFDLQAEIAQQVIQEMNVKLLGPEREALTSNPTESFEALQAYQLGRRYLFGLGEGAKDDLLLAEQMLERAVRLDPDFAEAHASLAAAHTRIWAGYDRSDERLELARSTLDRARELEPDLPLVHQSSGVYTYWVDRDYERAISELSLAAEGLPNDAISPVLLASVYWRRGDWDNAVTHHEKAVELDPRNGQIAGLLGGMYWRVRRYRDADRVLSLALSLAPDLPDWYWHKAVNYWLWKGETAEARRILEEMPYPPDAVMPVYVWFLQETYERNFDAALGRLRSTPLASLDYYPFVLPKSLLLALTLRQLDQTEDARAAFDEARVILEARVNQNPEDHRLHSALGIAYAGLGRTEDAIAAGTRGVELMGVSKDAWTAPWRIHNLAHIYTLVGDTNAALQQIDRLLSKPSILSVGSLELDPRWDPLRDHPRYQEIIEKYR